MVVKCGDFILLKLLNDYMYDSANNFVKKNTQNDVIYGELGRIPLQNTRYYALVKFLMKILQSDNKNILKLYIICYVRIF